LLLLLFKSLLFAQNNGFLYAILAYLYNVLWSYPPPPPIPSLVLFPLLAYPPVPK
jgi:hypothetical protein